MGRLVKTQECNEMWADDLRRLFNVVFSHSHKLVALATDKFLAEIVKDAKENGALRVGEKRAAPPLSMEVRRQSW